MKISTKGEYALRAVLDLLTNTKAGVVSLEAIANRQNVSLSYLEQIFSGLKKSGIVVATRGPSGGYSLSRPAKEIKILDVLRAAGDDPFERPKSTKPKSKEGKTIVSFYRQVEQANRRHLTKTLDEIYGQDGD